MNFVFCDSTQNYPKQFSPANTKLDLVTDYMIAEGHNVSIINSCFGYENYECKEIVFKKKRCFFYKRKKRLYIRNFFDILMQLKKLHQNEDKNILFITWNHFIFYVAEVIWARLLGYKVVVIFHEKNSSLIVNHNSLYRKIDSILFDSNFGYFCNAILPISNYLKNFAEKFKKPQLIFPIIADFSYTKIQNQGKGYFLYCGNVCYYRIINYILAAYQLHRSNTGNYKLHLVLNGPQYYFDKVLNSISENKYKDDIIVLKGLSKIDLLEEYSRANALLIPLDGNNEQDKARFSQKIAEYLSVKRPIITNYVGDIPIYFKGRKNAYIYNDFNVNVLASILSHIENNPIEANIIGENGFNTGKNHFDYKNVSRSLISFISQI